MIPRGFDIVPTLSTCHQWFPRGPLLASHLTWFFPGLFLPCSRPWLLTTAARRWFGTCSCQPVPRGLPSSIKQLHTLDPPRPFALVAHNRPRSSRYGRQTALPVWCSANPSTDGSCTSWRALGWPPHPADSRSGDPSLPSTDASRSRLVPRPGPAATS